MGQETEPRAERRSSEPSGAWRPEHLGRPDLGSGMSFLDHALHPRYRQEEVPGDLVGLSGSRTGEGKRPAGQSAGSVVRDPAMTD